jgi:8-oxo-dGTP pyrophosphatase MutT (NUDIX family)
MVRPRHASTVVLVRPEAGGDFAVLLTRRPAQMRFLGGCYVFPGGSVHQDDCSPDVLERCRGLSGEEARIVLGGRHTGELALGHWTAVIRELFEEVGIVLCVTESGEDIALRDPVTKKRFETKRQSMVREKLRFAEFLESEALYCDLSRVIYFFHRVTPEFFPMRFDTRFYIASLPSFQTPLGSSEEVTHSIWLKPAEALQRAYEHDFPILPPTTTVLDDLGRIASWEELRAEFRLP